MHSVSTEMANGFFSGAQAAEAFQGWGEPSLLETAASPTPALTFLGWSNPPEGHDGGITCSVEPRSTTYSSVTNHSRAGSFRQANHQHKEEPVLGKVVSPPHT